MGGTGSDELVFAGTESVPNAFSRTTADFTLTVTSTGTGSFTADLSTTYQTSPLSNSPIPPDGALGGRVVVGSGIERFIGAGGADIFDMGSLTTAVTINGGAGNDSIVGGLGADSLSGGDGADTIDGGSSAFRIENDAYVASRSGDNTIDGGAGDDVLIYGGLGAQTFIGGAGMDTLSFARLTDQFVQIGALPRATLVTYNSVLTVTGTGPDSFSAQLAGTTFSSKYIPPSTTVQTLDTIVQAGSGIERFIGGSGTDRVLLSSFNTSVTIDGGAGNDSLVGGFGADSLMGGAGADELDGGPGGQDTLNGGDGFDVASFGSATAGVSVSLQTLTASANGFTRTLISIEGVGGSTFNDTLAGGFGGDSLSGGDGADRISGYHGNDGLLGGAGADTLDGGGGNDAIVAGDGDDVILSSVGRDTVDGGAGSDTVVLGGTAASWSFGNLTGGAVHAVNRHTGTDIVITNIESFQFSAGGPLLTLTQAQDATFLPHLYLASNVDVFRAVGLNAVAATTHYNQYGRTEVRETGSFNALGYGASNPDLARAFGTNRDALARHYLEYGQFEGRSTTTFDPLRYAASSQDLATLIGADGERATVHYLTYGQFEGRSTTAFDPFAYLASNMDLNAQFGSRPFGAINTAGLTDHYLVQGVHAGRAINSFDALIYTASNADLAALFGTDRAASNAHYVRHGFYEGRPTNTFDAKLYAASHEDLARIIGDDVQAALLHYLNYGADEGRSVTGFDSVAYLLNNPSLAGMTATQALDQYLRVGADTGMGPGVFGLDQTSHAFTASGAVDRFDREGDRDWFSVTLKAGETVTFNGSGAVGTLSMYDSLGRLVATDPDGRDFVVSGTGEHYLVATAAPGGVGDFSITRTGATAVASDLQVASAAKASGDVSGADAYLFHDASSVDAPPLALPWVSTDLFV